MELERCTKGIQVCSQLTQVVCVSSTYNGVRSESGLWEFFTGLREGVQGVYPIGYGLGFWVSNTWVVIFLVLVFLSYSEGGNSSGDVGKILPNLVNISWCLLVLLIVISELLYFFFLFIRLLSWRGGLISQQFVPLYMLTIIDSSHHNQSETKTKGKIKDNTN